MKTASWIAAAVVCAALVASAPAHAQTVFAEYTITPGTTDYSFTSVTTPSPTYSGGLFSATTSTPITFRYDVPNGYGAPNTSITAFLNITSSVAGRPMQIPLGGGMFFDSQQLQTVSMTITTGTGGSGANLLSFSNASGTVSGFDQDTSGRTSGTAARGNNVVFTSDYLTFPALSSNSYTFAFTTVAPRFNITTTADGNSLDSFTGAGPGSFAGSPAAAPEPSALLSLAVMGGGLALCIARRRRTA